MRNSVADKCDETSSKSPLVSSGMSIVFVSASRRCIIRADNRKCHCSSIVVKREAGSRTRDVTWPPSAKQLGVCHYRKSRRCEASRWRKRSIVSLCRLQIARRTNDTCSAVMRSCLGYDLRCKFTCSRVSDLRSNFRAPLSFTTLQQPSFAGRQQAGRCAAPAETSQLCPTVNGASLNCTSQRGAFPCFPCHYCRRRMSPERPPLQPSLLCSSSLSYLCTS